MTTKDWLILGGIALFMMWRQGGITPNSQGSAQSGYSGKFTTGPVPPTKHPITLQY